MIYHGLGPTECTIFQHRPAAPNKIGWNALTLAHIFILLYLFLLLASSFSSDSVACSSSREAFPVSPRCLLLVNHWGAMLLQNSYPAPPVIQILSKENWLHQLLATGWLTNIHAKLLVYLCQSSVAKTNNFSLNKRASYSQYPILTTVIGKLKKTFISISTSTRVCN